MDLRKVPLNAPLIVEKPEEKVNIFVKVNSFLLSYTYVQVAFKEGAFPPPEIKSSIDLPENLDIFGQQINLSPVQQTLSPLQDAVASISRVVSGQPPLKVPIPGNRASSWLLITYLDDDIRISRGDGGLFVLAREGSPLLYQ